MINKVRNYLSYRRYKRYHRQQMETARAKYVGEGLEPFVTLVEPGSKRRFLDRSNTSYYELEHRFGVHVWVHAAVKTIADKGAVPPLILQNEDGEMMDTMLPMRPNPIQTWDELEQLIAIYLELTGNAFVYHDKENDEFLPLRPSRTRIVPDEDGRSVAGYGYNRSTTGSNITYARQLANSGKARWMYDDPEVLDWSKKEIKGRIEKYHDWVYEGKIAHERVADKDKDNWIPFEAEDVLHFKYVSPTHDFYGLPPIYPLLTNLTTELYARHWNKNFFENGAIPPGVLIIPKILPKTEFDAIKDKFVKQYGGTQNRGKPVVLSGGEAGADYKAFPGQHRDLEFLKGLDHGRDETLAVFGVPHVMVNAQMTGSHSSSLSPGIKEMRKIFWQDTIMPKLKMRAARWTEHFKGELPEGYTFGHDFSAISDLKPDYTELTKASINAIRGGMTIPEAREDVLGLPPDWKGVVFVPANMVPITHAQYMAGMPTPIETPEPDALLEPDDDEMPDEMPDQIKIAAD